MASGLFCGLVLLTLQTKKQVTNSYTNEECVGGKKAFCEECSGNKFSNNLSVA